MQRKTGERKAGIAVLGVGALSVLMLFAGTANAQIIPVTPPDLNIPGNAVFVGPSVGSFGIGMPPGQNIPGNTVFVGPSVGSFGIGMPPGQNIPGNTVFVGSSVGSFGIGMPPGDNIPGNRVFVGTNVGSFAIDVNVDVLGVGVWVPTGHAMGNVAIVNQDPLNPPALDMITDDEGRIVMDLPALRLKSPPVKMIRNGDFGRSPNGVLDPFGASFRAGRSVLDPTANGPFPAALGGVTPVPGYGPASGVPIFAGP